MRPFGMLSATAFLLVFAAPAAAQREAIGIFHQWGAFEEGPGCFAMAEPWRSNGPRGARPFASVSFSPRAEGQLHVRLSRAKRDGSAVLLRIDDRPWQLIGAGADAWAGDARADAEIVAAMRNGVEMTVESRSERGVAIRDRYQLRGAATAIDAAAIACAQNP